MFLNGVQQTMSGNTPSQYSPDTIALTLFRCSLRVKPCLAKHVWRYSLAISPDSKSVRASPLSLLGIWRNARHP